jgi:hypothetical protein
MEGQSMDVRGKVRCTESLEVRRCPAAVKIVQAIQPERPPIYPLKPGEDRRHS